MKITAINSEKGDISALESLHVRGEPISIRSVGLEEAKQCVGEEDLIFFVPHAKEEGKLEELHKLGQQLKFKDVPIIVACDAFTHDKDRAELETLGCCRVGYPLNPQELQAAVDKMTEPVGDSSSIDKFMIAPFVRATYEVLTTMVHMKNLSRKKVFLKKNYKMFGDVSGIMGVSGSAKGAIAISLPYDLAKKMVANMLAIDVEDLEPPDVHDGVGELINMVTGAAKPFFQDTPYAFVLSIPTVTSGAGHEVFHRGKTPCVVLIFEVEGAEFALQISLDPEEKAQ
jgi:chemotaxis protein CheX